MFDRICATNLGDPVSVPDDVIGTGLPVDLVDPAGDFVNSEYLIARINLMRVFAEAVESIYDRNSRLERQRPPLGRRIEDLYGKICHWENTLPGHLRLGGHLDGEARSIVVSLYLSYYQVFFKPLAPAAHIDTMLIIVSSASLLPRDLFFCLYYDPTSPRG